MHVINFTQIIFSYYLRVGNIIRHHLLEDSNKKIHKTRFFDDGNLKEFTPLNIQAAIRGVAHPIHFL